jgi:uncharacterized membrane protein YvbJ
MYCSNCGTKNSMNASFCTNCGQSIEHDKTTKSVATPSHTTKQTHSAHQQAASNSGLILLGWIAGILQLSAFIFGAAVSILASIATLIIAIVLVMSKKSAFDKRQGKILLTLWVIINGIAFIASFNAAQQAQQVQNSQSGYYQQN